MKKYFLNPGDIVCAIALISVGFVFALLSITLIFFCSLSTPGEIVVMVALALLLSSPLLWGVLYLNKYSGYMYFDDRFLVLKKNGKKEIINISDIKWIEIKYDSRNGIKGWTSQRNFRFFIRLHSKKENLNVILTNNIVFEIIKKHMIRIMPDQYHQIYLNTGSFDFRSKK